MDLLSKVLRRNTAFEAPIRPETPFVAIGDIHGRADLLDKMLEELSAFPDAPQRMVFVGDYIDRGDASNAVLNRLQILSKESGCVCLLGNHEVMMLDFIEAPEVHGMRWLRYGGLQTLASFGISVPRTTLSDLEFFEIAARLSEALGPTLGWLRRLPLTWRSGNVVVVHAACDPGRDLEDQSREDILWGHADFPTKPRKDGIWVVHGHSIVPRAVAARGVMSIDTGAFATDRLSGVIVRAHSAEIITV